MKPIESSETSAYINTLTPGTYPKEKKLQSKHGESLKSRSTDYLVDRAEHRPQVDHYSETLLSTQRPMDTPASESTDPSYHPSETPRSRRELQTTRFEKPINRARAKALSEDLEN